jgi:hypothetical protein
MSLILNIIIIASYFVVASAVALVAPRVVPALSADVAPLAAGMVFLVCAIAHLMYVQSNRNRRVMQDLTIVRRQTREIAEDLLSTQTQALQMRQTVDQAGRAGEQRVSEVIAEVKVLQGLIEVFSRKQEASALAAGEIQLAERPKLVAVEGGKAVSAPSGDDFDVYLQPIVSLPQRKKTAITNATRASAARMARSSGRASILASPSAKAWSAQSTTCCCSDASS